jgi:hypothetical protein
MGSHVMGHNIFKPILHLSLLIMPAELVKNHADFLEVNWCQDNSEVTLKCYIFNYIHIYYGSAQTT